MIKENRNFEKTNKEFLQNKLNKIFLLDHKIYVSKYDLLNVYILVRL